MNICIYIYEYEYVYVYAYVHAREGMKTMRAHVVCRDHVHAV